MWGTVCPRELGSVTRSGCTSAALLHRLMKEEASAHIEDAGIFESRLRLKQQARANLVEGGAAIRPHGCVPLRVHAVATAAHAPLQ